MVKTTTVQRKNKHGIEKTRVRVPIGTTELEVPKRIKNPITERTEDLTNLSDDGYLKPFLAVWSAMNRTSVIDLSDSPVLTFDSTKWDLEEENGHYVLQSNE